jgi:hypothetical protein
MDDGALCFSSHNFLTTTDSTLCRLSCNYFPYHMERFNNALANTLFLLFVLFYVDPILSIESDSLSVYAHYMGWFKSDTSWAHWKWAGHNPGIVSNGKRQIAAIHYPLIGPYSSNDSDLIACHLLQMKATNIDGIIIDWYQKDDLVDSATNAWFNLVEQWRRKYSLDSSYFGVALMVDDEPYRRTPIDQRVSAMAANINYLIAKYYSSHSAAIRFKGLPLIFYFPKTSIEDSAKFVFSADDWLRIKSMLDKPIYLVFRDPRSEFKETMNSSYPWISVAAHDSVDWGEAYLRWYYEELRWLTTGQGWANLDYRIGIAYPGFNDNGVYGWTDNPANTRKMLRRDPQNIETFDKTWNILDSFNSARPEFQYKRMQIATFNDWNEGTEVEPSVEDGHSYLKLCKKRIDQFKGLHQDDSTSLLIGEKYYAASKSKKAKKACLDKSLDMFFRAAYLNSLQFLDTAIDTAANDCGQTAIAYQPPLINKASSSPLQLSVSNNNRSVVILYNVPANLKVKIEIFDMRGRLVYTLVNQVIDQGIYRKVLNKRMWYKGVFLLQLKDSYNNEFIVKNYFTN